MDHVVVTFAMWIKDQIICVDIIERAVRNAPRKAMSAVVVLVGKTTHSIIPSSC